MAPRRQTKKRSAEEMEATTVTAAAVTSSSTSTQPSESSTSSSSSSSATAPESATTTTTDAAVTPDADGELHSRVLEKAELGGLNRRLETYILLQRERDAQVDAHARELQAVRAQAAADLVQAKRLYESQLDTMRQLTQAHRENEAELQNRIYSLENTITELNARIASLEETRRALDARIADLTSQLLQRDIQSNTGAPTTLLDSEDASTTARSSIEAVTAERDLARHELSHVQRELERKQTDHEAVVQLLAETRTRLAQSLSDAEARSTEHQAQVEQLQSRIVELLERMERGESTIRDEVSADLIAQFAAKEQQLEDAHKQRLLEVQHSVDETVRGFRTALQSAGATLAASEKANFEKERTIQDAKREHALVLAERDSLRARVEQLETSLRAAHTDPQLVSVVNETHAIIERLTRAYELKERQFDRLLDAKIELEAEIQAYRTLLENEERRLGVHSTNAAKRARRRSNEDAGVAGEDVDVDDPAHSLRIVDYDRVAGTFFTLQNIGSRALPLHGWRVQSAHSGQSFAFAENATIVPGGTHQLLVRARADGDDDAQASDATSVWQSDAAHVWQSPDDLVQLFDHDGVLIATARIAQAASSSSSSSSSSSGSSSSSSSPASSSTSDSGSCVVM